jgi:hypothetical protein
VCLSRVTAVLTAVPWYCPLVLLQGPIGHEYGKYGLIRETDMYSKRPEFQLWAMEVGGGGGGNWEGGRGMWFP